MRTSGSGSIHAVWVRCCHWVNVVAIAGMLFSGLRIYNASPLFPFKFPPQLTLGGWLGGALQWHFAMMWVMVINGAVYLLLGVFSGHFRNKFWPLSLTQLKGDLVLALRGKLRHTDPYHYNMAQKVAYLLVLVNGAALVFSGLVLWKPVQFALLCTLFGGYETARYIHFFCMSTMAIFILIHLLMVLLVPRTLLAMLRGR